MKKINAFFIISVIFLFSIVARAADYICTTNNGTISITQYIGAGGNVIIPSQIDGLPVTDIGESAFQNCTTLTGVVIPATVGGFGPDSFTGCSNLLRAVHLRTPQYGWVYSGPSDDGAFSGAHSNFQHFVRSGGSFTSEFPVRTFSTYQDGFVAVPATYIFEPGDPCYIGAYLGSGGNVIIPPEFDGHPVIDIGPFAFMNCATLTGVVIPATVGGFGPDSFTGCSNLAGIYFLGNAPVSAPVFESNNLTVYYAPETTGWGATFGSVPTAPWLQDSDTNDLPDWWEIKYFNASGVNKDSVCSNGINTVREAYIAGLNPVSSTSALTVDFVNPGACNAIKWQGVQGRVYSVYWTTNLPSGFQCVASNIPWTQTSFTNQGSGSGYYKITVKLTE